MLSALKKFYRPEPQQEIVTVPWHKYTPDVWYLEQHARQNIFIYDDLKLGKKNHDILEGHLPIHPTCYTHHRYTMWNKDLGEHSFPVVFEDGITVEGPAFHRPEPARIRGELYSLPSTFFYKVLDIRKENGVKFMRKRVMITLPHRFVSYADDSPLPKLSKEYITTKSAWMYIAIPEYWIDLIGCHLGSRAVPIYQHDTPREWIDQYYKF